jgi:hypothetical protein
VRPDGRRCRCVSYCSQGRHAKDPFGQVVRYDCGRLEDLASKFREYLDNPDRDEEHTTVEFHFPVTAAFMIPAREVLGKGDPENKNTPWVYSLFKKSAISVVDALHNISDVKEQMLAQKRISKTLADAIAEVDGFRYSFHNQWLSRDDNANRFSYYCNDSILNKGRAANEGLSKIGKVKVRKPVYECEGGIWVKFSLTKNNLEVHYKHQRIHETYDERAPVPRKGSRRRKLMEIFHPEKLSQPVEKKPPIGRKRKAEAGDKSSRKRRANERLQSQEVSVAGNDRNRESSLQPLFDFLGSAEQMEQDGHVPQTPARPQEVIRPAGAEPCVMEVVAAVDNPSQPAKNVQAKAPKHPGMLSGFLDNSEINWGEKISKKERAKRAQARRQQTDYAIVATPAMPATHAATPEPLSEVDVLKLKLAEMERKVQALEAEKSQPHPPPGGYHPQQHSSQRPPPHWQYLPAAPAQQAQHIPAYPLRGPPGAPASHHMPPAPAATHPYAYNQTQRPRQVSPQIGHNVNPHYGFVPHPSEPITQRIRPHLQPAPVSQP